MAVPARPTSGTPIETAWGQVAHDTAVAMDVQAGSATVTTTATVATDITITFPRPFASVPVVTCGAIGGNSILGALVSIPTATQCAIRVFKRDGSNLAAGSTVVQWMAYGPRA